MKKQSIIAIIIFVLVIIVSVFLIMNNQKKGKESNSKSKEYSFDYNVADFKDNKEYAFKYLEDIKQIFEIANNNEIDNKYIYTTSYIVETDLNESLKDEFLFSNNEYLITYSAEEKSEIQVLYKNDINNEEYRYYAYNYDSAKFTKTEKFDITESLLAKDTVLIYYDEIVDLLKKSTETKGEDNSLVFTINDFKLEIKENKISYIYFMDYKLYIDPLPITNGEEIYAYFNKNRESIKKV